MNKQILKNKLKSQLKSLGWRAITTVILTLTAVATVWVYAAFVEPAVGPNSSTQDFAQNILGANSSDNSFDSSSVASNSDGSVVEREEYLQQELAKVSKNEGSGSDLYFSFPKRQRQSVLNATVYDANVTYMGGGYYVFTLRYNGFIYVYSARYNNGVWTISSAANVSGIVTTTYRMQTIAIDTNTFVIITNNSSNYPVVTAGTITRATTPTIALGGNNILKSSTSANFYITKVDTLKFAVTYLDASNTYAKVGTVSGTTITLGAESTVNATAGQLAIASPNASTIVVAYTSGGHALAKKSTISGTTIGSWSSNSDSLLGTSIYIQGLEYIDSSTVMLLTANNAGAYFSAVAVTFIDISGSIPTLISTTPFVHGSFAYSSTTYYQHARLVPLRSDRTRFAVSYPTYSSVGEHSNTMVPLTVDTVNHRANFGLPSIVGGATSYPSFGISGNGDDVVILYRDSEAASYVYALMGSVQKAGGPTTGFVYDGQKVGVATPAITAVYSNSVTNNFGNWGALTAPAYGGYLTGLWLNIPANYANDVVLEVGIGGTPFTVFRKSFGFRTDNYNDEFYIPIPKIWFDAGEALSVRISNGTNTATLTFYISYEMQSSP